MRGRQPRRGYGGGAGRAGCGAQGNPIGVAGWAAQGRATGAQDKSNPTGCYMGRRGAGAQRSVAAWRRSAARQGAERIASSWQPITGRAWAASGRAITGRAWQHRGGRSPGRAWAASGRAITGRAWQHRGGAIPWQGAAAAGSRSHRQGAAAAGSRSPAGRGQQLAADHRQQGGQGLKAAKSSHAKDESPTGILSTHIRVAAEKNFFTPRRGVIWGEKRPFPARGRKPCYDFCVGRESPPAKQKLHSADHGAERIST